MDRKRIAADLHIVISDTMGKSYDIAFEILPEQSLVELARFVDDLREMHKGVNRAVRPAGAWRIGVENDKDEPV
jgi:hypothetical protein